MMAHGERGLGKCHLEEEEVSGGGRWGGGGPRGVGNMSNKAGGFAADANVVCWMEIHQLSDSAVSKDFKEAW